MFTYVAAPLKHENKSVEEARIRLANLYTTVLLEQGRIVYCPIVYSYCFKPLGLCLPIPETTWIAHSIYMMAAANDLLVLEIPGYKESIGVAAEIAYAELYSIPIEYSSNVNLKIIKTSQKIEEEELLEVLRKYS